MQFPKFLPLFDATVPNRREVLPHHGVQSFFVDTVGAAIAFPTPVVALADILHTPLAVPVPDHGDKYITALLAPEQPCIAVLGAVSVGWPGLLFQPLLNQFPYIQFHDDREEVFVAIPFLLLQLLCLATMGLRPMVDQHPTSPRTTFWNMQTLRERLRMSIVLMHKPGQS